MASGNKTRCMARVSIHGTMDATTLATILTTKRRAMASSAGQTAGPSRASGKTESRTASVSTITARARCAMAFGQKVGGSSGSMKRPTIFKWKISKIGSEEKNIGAEYINYEIE